MDTSLLQSQYPDCFSLADHALPSSIVNTRRPLVVQRFMAVLTLVEAYKSCGLVFQFPGGFAILQPDDMLCRTNPALALTRALRVLMSAVGMLHTRWGR